MMIIIFYLSCLSLIYPQTIIVNFNSNQTYQVNEDFFSGVTVTSVGDFDYTNAYFQKLIDSCGIKVLYYPGGSVARFAHYYPGAIGYGINTVQVVAAGYNVNDIINSPWYQDQLNNNNNFFEECVQLAKDKNLGLIICANVTTGYLSDIQNMMALCTSSNIPVKAMIFNTEVHLNADKHVFPNAKSYVDSISKYVTYMKTQYPNVPLSVNAAPPTTNTFFTNWNDTVSKGYITGIIKDSARGAINWWWDIPTSSTLTSATKDQVFSFLKKEMLKYFNNELPNDVNAFKNDFKFMDVVQMGYKNKNPSINPKLADSINNTLMAQMYFINRIFWKIRYNALNGEFFKSVSLMKISSATSHDPIYRNQNNMGSCTSNSPCTSTTFDAYVSMKDVIGANYYNPALLGFNTNSTLTTIFPYFFNKNNYNWFFILNFDSLGFNIVDTNIKINNVPIQNFTVTSFYGQNGFNLYSKKNSPYNLVKNITINPSSFTIYPHSITIIKSLLPPFSNTFDNFSDMRRLKLYPNPTKELFIIEGCKLKGTLEIFNGLGKLVDSKNVECKGEKIYYDISSLEDGVYIIKITTSDGTGIYEKLIKTK
ncbi:MAG: T9SS type A sorting domain-containing protein [Bacteroidia bacterium]|nr:T9SS type A sorting domain-containing protein [Bacteroidia bacterium]